MVPSALNGSSDMVYYPLQCPFAKINTFKSNQSNSAYSELEMLQNVLLAYQSEFTEEHGSAFSYCTNQTQFASDAKLFRGCVTLKN